MKITVSNPTPPTPGPTFTLHSKCPPHFDKYGKPTHSTRTINNCWGGGAGVPLDGNATHGKDTSLPRALHFAGRSRIL